MAQGDGGGGAAAARHDSGDAADAGAADADAGTAGAGAAVDDDVIVTDIKTLTLLIKGHCGREEEEGFMRVGPRVWVGGLDQGGWTKCVGGGE